jgi:exodeoxyribonuclease VII small subunit
MDSKNSKTFEESLREIENIVSAMERGDLTLEDSIQSFERGMKQIEECNKKLLSAEKTIKILEKKLSGQWEEKDFDSHEKQDGTESSSSLNKKNGKSTKSLKTSEEDSATLELF